MGHQSYANRLFLLTLLPLACDLGSDSDSTTSPATSGAGTGGATTGDDTTGGMPDTGGDTVADSGSTTDTPADTTAGETDPTGGSDTTSGELACEEPPVPKGEISQLCVDYAGLIAKCLFEGELPVECEGYFDAVCEYTLEYYEAMDGAACRTAQEEWYACINEIPCADMTKEDCATELAAAEAACPTTGK